MSKMILLFQLWIITFGLSSCNQEISIRNQIVFEDSINSVADSIAKIDELMYKLPENGRINYFIDNEGNLFINNKNLGSLNGAINNPKFRKDESFYNFTTEEVYQFFHLMAYLFRNHIDASYMNKKVSRFMFEYRRTKEGEYDDLRLITLKKSGIDSKRFINEYQIIDQEYELVLVAPADAQIY